jgi:hypothetical protein
MMILCAAALGLCCVQQARGAAAGKPEPDQSPYPLWDGSQSVESYAQSVGVKPTRKLDLGELLMLDLVLVPAGRYLMGTPEAGKPDEAALQSHVRRGQAALLAGATLALTCLLVLAGWSIARKRMPRWWPAWLLGVALGVLAGWWGRVQWHQAQHTLASASVVYAEALGRAQEAADDERPAHRVTITRPFYIGKFEVTQEQYEQLTGSNPSVFKGRELPVEYVSWQDAENFCRRLSEKAGCLVRLPTEAEWELACRAGSAQRYHSGDSVEDLAKAAWYAGNSDGRPQPVGRKEPNRFGAHDMHGNVWEWCEDSFDEKYYASSPAADPWGPLEGPRRVLRGGAWDVGPLLCRSAGRHGSSPTHRVSHFGFRVAVPVLKAR